MKTAIKVKIKRDQAGIGHDMAEEFTFQWWDHVFNRAASKIKIKGENDSENSDSDSASDSNFDISNKKPISKKTKKKYDPTQILYGRFVSGGLLVDDNAARLQQLAEATTLNYADKNVPASIADSETEDVSLCTTTASSKSPTPVVSSGADDDDDSSDDEDEEDLMKLYAAAGLPEEELFRRCGGRTAHKGARHGLKASAKLERIERQDGNVKPSPGPLVSQPNVPPSQTVSKHEITPVASADLAETKTEKKRKKRLIDIESIDNVSPIKKSKKRKSVIKENKHASKTPNATDGETPAATDTVAAKAIDSSNLPAKKKKKKRKSLKGDACVEQVASGGAKLSSHLENEPTELPIASHEIVDLARKQKKKKKKNEHVEPQTSENSIAPLQFESAVRVKKKKKKIKQIENIVPDGLPFDSILEEKKEKRKKEKAKDLG